MNEEAYRNGSGMDLCIGSDWIWYSELRMRSVNVWDVTVTLQVNSRRDGSHWRFCVSFVSCLRNIGVEDEVLAGYGHPEQEWTPGQHFFCTYVLFSRGVDSNTTACAHDIAARHCGAMSASIGCTTTGCISGGQCHWNVDRLDTEKMGAFTQMLKAGSLWNTKSYS